MDRHRAVGYASLYCRCALGIGFLSSVADRFGVWGAPGTGGVAWGSFHNFLAYTAVLNPFLPGSLIPIVGWCVTFAETGLGLALVLGYRIREAAILGAILLLAFALGMTIGLGVKAPVDYSVFPASAGALLLGLCGRSFFSIDALRARRSLSPRPPRRKATWEGPLDG